MSLGFQEVICVRLRINSSATDSMCTRTENVTGIILAVLARISDYGIGGGSGGGAGGNGN